MLAMGKLAKPSLRAERSNPWRSKRKGGLLRRIRLRPKAGFGGLECSSQ